jgi:sterol 3beta-glucosyltransferase
MTMKIGMLVWGTNGDVRPFIALASGLSEAGHDITLAVASVDKRDYQNLRDQYKIKIQQIPFPGNYYFENEDLFWQMSESDALKKFTEIYERIKAELNSVSIKLCQENELVIGNQHILALTCAAEKFHIPYVSISNEHSIIPTENMPPPGYPAEHGKIANLYFWALLENYINEIYLGDVNKFREQEELPPVKNVLQEITHSRELNLVAVSSVFCKQQPDWNKRHRLCGFLELEENLNDYSLPDNLLSFLSENPSPIFMTAGSMMIHEKSPLEITKIYVEAANLVGCSAIIQSNWEQLQDINKISSSDKVFKLRHDIPYKVIWPKCSAVVHHGGTGTTHTTILCGCPSVVVEYGFDQEFCGKILRELGIAPTTLHRKTVTAELLANEIRIVLNTPEMKLRAEELSQIMKNENGVKKAVEFIEGYFC